MSPRRVLPYSRQNILPDDLRAVVRILKGDWLTTGPSVAEFERKFAAYVGAKHAVAVSSGTAALHAACFAAGVGPGDEVVVPATTFVATANAAVYLGATPRFADVDPETGLMDPEAAEGAVTRKTRAIIPVDFAGHPADLDAFRRIARRHRLVLIDDAAHALGAAWRGDRIGSLADFTTFSFHPVKHITTGEGGMITTDDGEAATRMRMFRHHGIMRDPQRLSADEGPWYHEMQVLGFNYRITDFQCALGISQLAKVERFIKARRDIARRYTEAFNGMDGVRTPQERKGARHVYHIYPLRLALERLKRSRREIFEEFRKAGLGVQVLYIPVPWQPFYRKNFGTRRGQFPGAERFYESEISLPIFPQMRNADVARVIRTVRSVIGRAAR
jgi:UDP-4-amino-4,6-dideoxy-N-acetyl-beta-L-altrosamine transaminase